MCLPRPGLSKLSAQFRWITTTLGLAKSYVFDVLLDLIFIFKAPQLIDRSHNYFDLVQTLKIDDIDLRLLQVPYLDVIETVMPPLHQHVNSKVIHTSR